MYYSYKKELIFNSCGIGVVLCYPPKITPLSAFLKINRLFFNFLLFFIMILLRFVCIRKNIFHSKMLGLGDMDLKNMKKLALEMIRAGINAANPELLVINSIRTEKDILYIKDRAYHLKEYDNIFLFGIGKASVPMASALSGIDPTDGLVLSNIDCDRINKCPVPVKKVKHPYPDKFNLEASKELISKLKGANDALIIFLVSGGGSSMFTVPVDGVSMEEINDLNRLLVISGMDIDGINTVRKHVSKVKGGRAAEMCEDKGTLISLILSDVVGDDLSSIASGPTVADKTTYEDAVVTLKSWGLWNEVSNSIKQHLESGLKGEIEDTPKKVKSLNYIIGNNMTALKGMKKFGKERGMPTVILTSQNTGEAKCTAYTITGIAKEIQDTGTPFEPPVALVMGGEMTVKFDGDVPKDAFGGPNREFVLRTAMKISGRKNMVIASADSDGVDGKGKAGAIAHGNSIKRCPIDAKKCLEEHRSQDFFDSLSDSVELKSKTNVNDITVVLIGEP